MMMEVAWRPSKEIVEGCVWDEAVAKLKSARCVERASASANHPRVVFNQAIWRSSSGWSGCPSSRVDDLDDKETRFTRCIRAKDGHARSNQGCIHRSCSAAYQQWVG